MTKYEVVYYYDVWGNAEDGYDVNDLSRIGYVSLPDNYAERDILNALIDIGAIDGDATLYDAYIYDNAHHIEIEDINGMPIYVLREVD